MFGLKDVKNLKNLDKDDLLDLIGLQTRQTTADWLLPTIGAFSVGILVGAGIGLLLAPKPGHQLREDLRNRLQGSVDPLGTGFASAAGASSGVGSTTGVPGTADRSVPPRSI